MSPQPGVCATEKENTSDALNKKSRTPKNPRKDSKMKKTSPKSNIKKNLGSTKGMMDLSKWLVKGEKRKESKRDENESSANETSEIDVIETPLKQKEDSVEEVEDVQDKAVPEVCEDLKNSSSDTKKRKPDLKDTDTEDKERNEINLSGRKKRNVAKRRRIIVLDDSDS